VSRGEILCGAKVLQFLGVDVEIVDAALKIAVWDHSSYQIAHFDP
jgi:hypothetical protein